MTFTVTITGGGTPEVYVGLSATKLYVAAMFGDAADAFNALDDNDMSRVLVAVTRYIDAQSWQGAADAAGGTTLQLPRSGLVDADGNAISDATQLALVASAVGEMCALVADDPDILTAQDNANNLKEAGAGGATVQFFNPTTTLTGTATVLPTVVQRLLGAWLASSVAASSGGEGGNGECRSGFSERKIFDRRWPY